MFVNDQKQKIIKNTNSQNEKDNNIKYPDLYSHIRYGNNNNSKKNRLLSSDSKNSKNLSRTSSGFFERNYNNYLKRIYMKKNFINSSMIKKKELDDLLYKLKNYNNEVMTYTTKKSESLKHLKNTLKMIEFKYNKLKELQDIELPDEKISVKNFNELKMSKTEIEQKLFLLLKEKQDIDYSLKNEQEYNKTIEYMFEDEQNRLLTIKRETNIIEEKLYNVGKYQKIVNDNLMKSDKKNNNYDELNKKIDNDIKLIDKVIEKQYQDNKKLDNEIIMKEKEIKDLEEQLKELKEYNNSDMDEYKKEINEQIEKAKEVERKRIDDEKKYIEIIYCLYIIQKYFTDEEHFNKQNLLSSKDYQLLIKMNTDNIYSYSDAKRINSGNITKIILGKTTNNNSFNNTKKMDRTLSSIKIGRNCTNNTISQEDKKSYNSTTLKNNSNYNLNKNKSFKNMANKTSSTFFHTKLDINSFYNNENNIDELIDRFNEIKLTKQVLFDYNSSLMSKLNFYRYQLDDFHYKELKFEEQKKNYNAKVQEIISNNYFNFEELTKDNEKCKQFLEKNEYFINRMKKNNKKIKMNKIIETINKDDLDEISIEIKKENTQNNEIKKNIDNDDIVFKLSKNIIMTINNFFLTCSDSLKEIIKSINNINNNNINGSGGASGDKKNSSKIEDDNSLFMKENNITDENSNNPFIEVFKKIAEYQKNKEVNISNDYKMLLQYIKNLIHYCENNPNILDQSVLQEININLVDKFYKPGDSPNTKKIDKLFIKRFLSKKTPNYNNIFTHFTTLLEPSISNIKSLYELANDESNQNYLDNISQNKNDIIAKANSNKKVFQPINNSIENINSNEIIENELKNKKIKKLKRLSSSTSEINQYEELCFDDEDIDSIDTQSTKKKIVRVKKKVKSIDEKVINKLYTPFLAKTVYLRQLNPNIPGIKQMTSSSSKTNYEIKKMISDVDTISHQMKIYNNPILDPNRLCDNTYNSLVKLMLNDNNNKKIKVKSGKIRRKKKEV